MKLLLVVGLAGLGIVMIIAVFLSFRLGRGDDHEEPVRPGSRDRRPPVDEDSRWQDADARDTRRVKAASRTGSSGGRGRDDADAGHYRDRGVRRSTRQQAARGREPDYDYPDHYSTLPAEHPSSPQRAVARNGRPANGREYRDRPADGRRDQRATGPQDYPDYPDYHSGPQRGYPSQVHPSGPLPVPGFHSGDYPSADYPSMDFPSGPLAADHPSGPLPADHPSADYPAVPASSQPGSRSRSKSGPGKNGGSREQPESRRKPAKGRSRSKRDDDDWPSTEWDKLTDEQYWAELSSDKPLSSGRAVQPASEPALAAGNGRPRSANAQQAAAHGGAAPLPPADRGRELPSRKAPGQPPGPVTERQPVRGRPQPPAPARAANGSAVTGRAGASLPRPADEPSIAVLSSLATGTPARPYGALDEDPLTSPSFSRPAVDSRSYQRPRSGAHRQQAASLASASYGPAGHGTPGYRPDSYQAGTEHPSLAYPAGGYSGPLSAPPASPAASTPAGGYQLPGPAGPGYAYPPGQPPQASSPGWHTPPDEPAPVQGNPYGSYVDPAPAGYPASQADYPASHPGGGHAYPPGPASSYPGPGVSQPPGPYQPAIAAAGHGAAYPQAGYPGDDGYGYQQHASQAAYPAPPEAASYPPGYGNGYPADSYRDNGYGYPAAQG